MNAFPDRLFYGDTPDISHLRFPFGATVIYRARSSSFPVASGLPKGVYLGPNTRDGDAFTYFVIDITTRRIFSRCVVQSDPSTKFDDIYTNLLDRLDFFTDESYQRSIDARASPSEWVPVLIHDDVCPDITLKVRKDTVDPVAKTAVITRV